MVRPAKHASRGDWWPEWDRTLGEYARKIASGRYPSVRQAARDYCARQELLHRERTGGRPPAGPVPPSRTLKTVETYLLRWSHALGRKRVVGWTGELDAVVSKYARALASGEYRTVAAALPDCWRELTAAGQAPGHTRRAVQSRLLARAREFGLAQRRHRWPASELRILDRFAKSVVNGEYSTAASAVADCKRAFRRAGLTMQHPDTQFQSKLSRRARAFGRPPVVVYRTPEETRVLDRFARHIVGGKYRNAVAALPDCREALSRMENARLRTDGAVTQDLTARAKALRRTPLVQRWTPAEMAIADRHARELARGTYARIGSAVAACRQELAAGGFPARRTQPAVHYQLTERARKLGWRAVNMHFTPRETQILDRVARAVVDGRYRTSAEAAPDCHRRLRRVRPQASRSTVTLAMRLRTRVRALGKVHARKPWSDAEDRIISRYAGRVLSGEYGSAPQAAIECVTDVNRLRRKRCADGSPLPERTADNVLGRLWHTLAKAGIPRPQALWSPDERRIVERYARRALAHEYPSLEHAALDCWAAVKRANDASGAARLGVRCRSPARTRASVHAKLYEMACAIDHRQLPQRRWSAEEQGMADAWIRRYDLHRRGRLRMGLDTMGQMLQSALGRNGYYRTDAACRAKILERWLGSSGQRGTMVDLARRKSRGQSPDLMTAARRRIVHR